jgi:hypothetical protein
MNQNSEDKPFPKIMAALIRLRRNFFGITFYIAKNYMAKQIITFEILFV